MEEQVTRLNERFKARIAPSPIHGVGVFAIRDIAKGQKLYADATPEVYTLGYGNFSKLFLPVRELLLERFPQIVVGSKFVFPTDRLQAYMNHGYGEAENYDAIHDIVLKDIKKGEEILEDYTKISGYATVFPWLVK